MLQSHNTATEAKGVALVLVSAAGFGALAIFAKLSYQAGAAAFPVLNWRFLLSSLFMLAYFGWKRQNLRLPPRDVGSLFLLGAIGYGSMSTFFFLALKYISAATASMFLYTYPALVSLLSFLIWRKPLTLQQMLSLLTAAGGTTFLLWDPGVSLNTTGVLLALGAAVAYSFYLVWNQHLSHRVEPTVAAGYIIFAAALGFSVLNLVLGSFTWTFNAKAWTAISLMAFFSTALAITTLITGIKLIGAAPASIISTFEPLVTVVLALGLLGEKLTANQVAGGLLILSGIVIVQWPRPSGPVPRQAPPESSLPPAPAPPVPDQAAPRS